MRRNVCPSALILGLLIGFILTSYRYWELYYKLYTYPQEELNIQQRLILGESPHDVICTIKGYQYSDRIIKPYFRSTVHLDILPNGYREDRYLLTIPKYNVSLYDVVYRYGANSTSPYYFSYQCYCGCNSNIPDSIIHDKYNLCSYIRSKPFDMDECCLESNLAETCRQEVCQSMCHLARQPIPLDWRYQYLPYWHSWP